MQSSALIGNPNCGKTTLFNALTKSHQKVGNWPGVTVEQKIGHFEQLDKKIAVIDLPGIYSLVLPSETLAVDEQIAVDFIENKNYDFIINILDASKLERHLYLTLQLLESDKPVVLALNMMDVAKKKGIEINLKKLSELLGCPIIPVSAAKGDGIKNLKHAILTCKYEPKKHFTQPAIIEKAVSVLQQFQINRDKALRLLENDYFVQSKTSEFVLKEVQAQQKIIQNSAGEEADILIADARYQFIQKILKTCVITTQKPCWTKRIDAIVLNPILAIPIFLGMMYALFVFAINIGGAFQDFFDISSKTIFVDGLTYLLHMLSFPLWLTSLLANGLGKGINTTVTFIPVIGAMFLFLSFLEDSGYMARAAFVVDRLMRMLGLPGKAFVPMIVGFGCNVPAVMGARTLENKSDRILTIMMAPFMSCGARLAIFAVFTAAFFPKGGQNIVFALYLIGILMAVFTGFLLRKTLLKGEIAPLIMELPDYHLPKIQTLCKHTWQRLKNFVIRAGMLIVPICILIGALNTINVDGSINSGGDIHSLLSTIGQWLTPIFHPMGIQTNNWPATVGLLTGVLAKEVVVGTLNTLYSQVGHFAALGGGETFHFWQGLMDAFQSIPNNLMNLGSALSNPILAKAPIKSMNDGVYGLMYQQFDGQIGAFAYLLFVLLYFPCVSTMAAMLREMHRGWSIFSAVWMTGVAYGTAVGFYQLATLNRHPISSLIWLSGICLILFIILFLLKTFALSRTK